MSIALFSNLQRLKQERVKLKEENEELQLSVVTGAAHTFNGFLAVCMYESKWVWLFKFVVLVVVVVVLVVVVVVLMVLLLC